jgi:hypothetical protein
MVIDEPVERTMALRTRPASAQCATSNTQREESPSVSLEAADEVRHRPEEWRLRDGTRD